VAQVVLMIRTNGYVTGEVKHVDGPVRATLSPAAMEF
jgi:hypothetical protein